MKRFLLLMALALVTPGLVFSAAQAEEEEAPDVYEYSVYFDGDELLQWWDNENDIVTPYINEKFGLEMGEQFWRSGQMPEERLNTFVASGTMPDVFISGFSIAPQMEGLAYDLTELVPEHMPNYWNNVLSEADRQLNHLNGKILFVFKKDSVDWSPESLADPYEDGYGLSLQMREDILTKLGYEFTPTQEIQEIIKREQRPVTWEDFEITHPDKDLPTYKGVSMPYRTPEQFADFLQEIQDAGITDAAGNPVFPMSLRWGIQILGPGAFDWSNGYRWNEETQQAEGFLGSSETYEFLHWWWEMYRDGLLDPDYVIQTNTQLEEKVNSGRVAMFLEPNHHTVEQSWQRINEDWHVRPMPNPMGDPHSYWYPYTPGYFAVFLNKDLPEEIVIRFLKMWDYMYTEEGLTTLMYGPQEAGFRTVRDDGRVVFTEEMWDAYNNMDAMEEGSPSYYGLAHVPHRWGNWWSTIAYLSAAPRDGLGYEPARAMPPDPTVWRVRRLYDSIAMALEPGFASAQGEASKAAADYWHTPFKYQDIANLLNAETKAEFDEAYEMAMERNETVGRYSEAVEEMTEYFKTQGFGD